MPGGKRTDETGVCPPGKSSEKDRQYQAGDDPADDLLYGNSSERAEFRDGKGCQAGIRRGVLQREKQKDHDTGKSEKKTASLHTEKWNRKRGGVYHEGRQYHGQKQYLAQNERSGERSRGSGR